MTRYVAMDQEQADLLDELTERLIREADPRAMKIGSLVIAFKFAAPSESPIPDNVIDFSRRVGA